MQILKNVILFFNILLLFIIIIIIKRTKLSIKEIINKLK